MKWLIYTRISTEEQSKWVSLEYQKESCQSFCLKNDITVKDENIFSEIYSWAFFERPKLSQIFEIIKSQDIDCIVVIRRDRVARDMWVFTRIEKILEELSVKIFYAEEVLTGDEYIDTFMWNTLIGFAQYEKQMIFKRTYSWRRQVANNWQWTTQVPYGYIKNNDRYLELYKPEVKIIKLIVKLYLEENKTLWEISWYLNEAKILPPSMSEKKSATQLWFLKRRKNAIWFWWVSAVSRTLENVEKYYTWEYKAFTTQYKKVWDKSIVIWKRDKKDIITIKIPQLFDKKTAKRINIKKKINRNHADKKSFRTYLLKGKLFCDCQSDFRNFKWYYNNTKWLRNYRCTMSDKRKTSENRRCNNNISWLKIDTLVIDTLKDFFLDYNKFLIEYSLDAKTNSNNTNIIEQYKYDIEKLEMKEKRALDLYLDEALSKDKFKEIQQEVQENTESLKQVMENEYDSIYDEYKKGLLNGKVKHNIQSLFEHASNYFETASYEEIKQLVDIIIDKVIYSTDKTKPVRIILNVSPWDFDLDEYLKSDRKTSIVREYGNQKTQLNQYQVEFSRTPESVATEWGDFKFINLLKESYLFCINGGTSGARTQDLPLKRGLLYQLS